MPVSDLLLRVSNLEVYYGPIQAVRGATLEIPRGSIVAVLGANGAGKTTVLRAISGAMDPERGQVVFDGKEIRRLSADRVMRLGICHVPEGREIFPLLSVRENLLIGAYTRNDTDRIASDMEMCFDYFPILRDRASQRAGLLSGGQQQMLAIGRALMGKPKLLLLDEPSLGLSPLLVTQIFDIIRRINQEQGVAVLLVEQNSHLALKIANYGYVLELGRVVMHDCCANLMKNEDIRQFYLGDRDAGVRAGRRWKRKKLWS